MIENTFVKKMVASIKQGRKNASYDRHIMHPEREWFLLVLCGLIVFAVGVVWNITTDQKFKNVSVSYVSGSEEQVVYRAGLVESALADFAKRKSEYEELKNSLVGRQPALVPVVEEVVVSEEAVTETEESPVVPEPTVEDEPVDVGELRFE